jgi:hypothetical protein
VAALAVADLPGPHDLAAAQRMSCDAIVVAALLAIIHGGTMRPATQDSHHRMASFAAGLMDVAPDDRGGVRARVSFLKEVLRASA